MHLDPVPFLQDVDVAWDGIQVNKGKIIFFVVTVAAGVASVIIANKLVKKVPALS